MQTLGGTEVVYKKVKLSPHAWEGVFVQGKPEGSPTGVGITGANNSYIFVATTE